MKKKVIISYTCKRTHNLGEYQNIVPMYSITEEIELDKNDSFTQDQYEDHFLRLKKMVRAEMVEDGTRIRGKDFSYLSDAQASQIFKLCKEKKLSVDEQVKATGFTSLGSLTQQAATNLIQTLTTK